MRKFKKRIWNAIQNNRRNVFVARLARYCKNIHRAFEHPGDNPSENGEFRLLTYLIKTHPLNLVFDVGANAGLWTKGVIDRFPNAQVHSFEVAPLTFQRLKKNLENYPTVHCNPFGLHNHKGHIPFSFCPENPELSSTTLVAHNVPSIAIQVEINTGDNYVKQHNLSRIDFLKIDTEGVEYEVLEGFQETLSKAPPPIIQFEHFLGRHYLKDYYNLLLPLGYKIGKLYSRYVDFRPHDVSLEDGIGPNYIAVHQDHNDLAEKLNKGFSQ